MSEEEIHQLIQEHHAFYVVQPHYTLTQTHEPDGGRASRTVHAGFDIDVYALVPAGKWQPAEDYWTAYASARKLIESIEAHATESCSIEVIPFASSVIVDTHTQMQRQARLRIRISHGRGLDQPAGPSEKCALKELETLLQGLGISSRGGGA